MKVIDKIRKKERRHKHIMKKLWGTAARPRLIVFRSNKFIYVQLVNDDENKIISGMSTLSKEFKEANKGGSAKDIKAAELLGSIFAKKCKSIKVKTVVFDRNGYKYHGRIKVLADSIRKGGIKF